MLGVEGRTLIQWVAAASAIPDSHGATEQGRFICVKYIVV